jgi:hypothetical protein
MNNDGSWVWGTDEAQPGSVGHYFVAHPGPQELSGANGCPRNQWHHFAMTYRDATNTYEFWIHDFDGSNVQLVGYETGTYDIGILNNSRDLNVGACETGGYPFKGLLDEVCMFDRALSGSEIRTLVPEPGALTLLGSGLLLVTRRKR